MHRVARSINADSIVAARIFSILIFILVCSWNTAAQVLDRFEYEQPQMGTTFKIILYSTNQQRADFAAQKAFNRIKQLNEIMSDYMPESEVSLLTRKKESLQKIKVSRDLYRVLKQSKKWAKRSNGHFDITIGPLSKLWRKAFRQQEFPDTLLIQQALLKVNYKNLIISPFSKKIKLKKQGMRIDLGGIAKGYAVDEAMKILKQEGIKIALVEGGGDILVSNPPPKTEGWKIRLPNSNESLILKNKAIATSGSTFQYLEYNGKLYSHIINPKTGYGASNQTSLTVIAKNCTDADALASTCILLSREEIQKLKKKKHWKVLF